ncbi:hypothetical protein RA210_U20416 [Rubrivivax sp. A210]|uniref:PEP-CTERM sorting domain-containing protein n=1 Tax=Rubrivivax sp. A210 TaxID=2772301 RepID=UPI00191B722D|nr:PEP-CTERM sorting domain-containing protein [Rubrivivax sp. A210]CAD5372433.1 hypothetical protein RA210_U20416 [Rubrivivax sp. A210]
MRFSDSGFRSRPSGRRVGPFLAGLLLAVGGAVQAVEVYDWYPSLDIQTAYLGEPGHWVYMQDFACPVCEGGINSIPAVAAALGPMVTARMHGAMINGHHFQAGSLNMPAVVDRDTVLGSLHLLAYNGAAVPNQPPDRVIRGLPGSPATLSLTGLPGAPLVVGAAGGGSSFSSLSPVAFEDLRLTSQGTALVHAGGTLALRGQTLWAHDGSIVFGASAPADGAPPLRYAGLNLWGGSLVPTLGGRLEIVAGSVSPGVLSVGGGGASALLETHVLTVGGEQGRGSLSISGIQSVVRVLEDFRVDRGQGGLVDISSGAQFEASSGSIGHLASAFGANVQVASGSSARFLRRTVSGGFFSFPVGGTLDVGTDSVGGGSGMRGTLTTGPDTTLAVEDRLSVGGGGVGVALLGGAVSAGSIQIGRSYAAGSGRLETRGDLLVGDPNSAFAGGGVSMEGRADWVHGGQGTVLGSIGMGVQGGNPGQSQVLQIVSGGVLDITGGLELGTYRDSNVSPLLLVEAGGRLTLGQAAVPALAMVAAGPPTVSIYGRGEWILAGQGLVHGDVAIGESTTGSGALPRLTVEQGGVLQVNGSVLAGSSFGGTPNGQLRADVVLEAGATLQTSGALVLNTDTRLAGSGTVLGTVEVNGGTVAPGFSPGHLRIAGDLRIGEQDGFGAGTLLIELGEATAPGQGYDLLEVSGQLALGAHAVLEIHLLPGFDAGGSYEFLRFGSLAADGAGGPAWFSQLQLVDAGGGSFTGLDFRLDGGRFGLHLAPAAVPEPASALLLLAGGLGMAVRRRRALGHAGGHEMGRRAAFALAGRPRQ